MAVQRLILITRILQFGGRLWLAWFKAALCMSLVGILASVVQVSLSQSGMGSGFDDMNETNVSCIASPDMNCSDLPDPCLNCSFTTECVYGDNTTVNCTVVDGVQCVVSLHYNLIKLIKCGYYGRTYHHITLIAPQSLY